MNPKNFGKTLKNLAFQTQRLLYQIFALKKMTVYLSVLFPLLTTLNNFFSNLAQNLIEKLPTGPNKFHINSAREFYKPLNLKQDLFHFTQVSEKTISDFLKELKTNNATAIDNLSDRFLKDRSKVLATPLAQICNLSIKLSTVPDECKIVKLKPLYKKGKKIDPKNYRPISLLPVISKILEKVIHDQTMDFVTKKNILYKFKSGFRKFHSTDSCLSYLQDKVSKGFDSGLLTGMILIDLQKAFDTFDILDESLSGESVALKLVSKINTRLKCLYRKNKFLSTQLRRLLYNALIHPHFDYAYSVWYPTLKVWYLKTKLQTLQKKCVRFCLQLDNIAQVGITELKKINWLPVDYRFRQCLAANVFKFFVPCT